MRGCWHEGTHLTPDPPNRPTPRRTPERLGPGYARRVSSFQDAGSRLGQRRDRRPSAWAPWGALAVAGAAWAAVAVARPGDGGPVWCPWRAVTGLDCPFCGATRAMASLGHGDVVAALDHNALLVLVVLPMAALGWALWVARARAGQPLPQISNRALTLGLLVVGMWWVLRLAVPWLGSGAVA